MIDTCGERVRQHRRLRILRAEVVLDVGVICIPVALDLPVPRDLYPVPAGGFHGEVVVVLKVLEVPYTVEVHVVLALTESLCEGFLTVGVIDNLSAFCLCV